MFRIFGNRLRSPFKEKLSQQSSISFVIASTGLRDTLLDTVVIPSILSQGINKLEIVIAGGYQGRYVGHPHVKYVPVKAFPVYFYKPFQKGVQAARGEWIVDIDDDMSLEIKWYEHLMEQATKTAADIYGFRLLNADGSLYGDLFDVFSGRQDNFKLRMNTYFGSYIARKEIYHAEPYPTFMSGDRYHGLRISLEGYRRKHLQDVCVIHHGTQSKNVTPEKADPVRFVKTKTLQKRLHHYPTKRPLSYEHRVSYLKKWWAYASKMEKQRKKIGILGWFGHDNVGDELILHNMLQSLTQHKLYVYTDQPERTRAIHGISDVFHYRHIRTHLAELDLLLVGGGGLLNDAYIKKVLPPTAIADADRTPVIVYAAGIPFFSWCRGLRYFLEKCYLVSLRDKLCKDFFDEQFSEIPNELLPDPAFLTTVSEEGKSPGKVTLNIRMIPKGWDVDLPVNVNQILIRELRRLYHHLIHHGYKPIILGFEPRDEEWIKQCGCGGTIVDFNEAVKEIATSEFLIGARYHAGVIAATQQTPSLLINYQQKVKSLTTLLPSAVSVVNIQGLDLVRAFEERLVTRADTFSFNQIEELKQRLHEFNDLYINHRP